jgi:hypothetical protein
MSPSIYLAADTVGYPEGGGHFWVYLNWALALEAAGCRVTWLEAIDDDVVDPSSAAAGLRTRLEPYGLRRVAVCRASDGTRECAEFGVGWDPEEAAQADLLINFRYSMPASIVERFRRSALIDIDPGLLQVWMTSGLLSVASHDVYFTTGERVGEPGSGIASAGRKWNHTPPCVALEWWPLHPARPDAPFTTVSHWHDSEWVDTPEGPYHNDKRTGFLAFLNVPRQTSVPLELALCLGLDEDDERQSLRDHGWRVRDAAAVAATPWAYQQYIGESRGEFSCAKPSCVRLQAGWISDRTLCYLASGKPAVVQYTGPSRLLPDEEGVFRFRDSTGAVRGLERVVGDYDRQCRLARTLVEERFDGKIVARRVLERALA